LDSDEEDEERAVAAAGVLREEEEEEPRGSDPRAGIESCLCFLLSGGIMCGVCAALFPSVLSPWSLYFSLSFLFLCCSVRFYCLAEGGGKDAANEPIGTADRKRIK